ncbi:MAG: hypothetical protein ACTSUO_00785 [Candidatus Thorarchaeota archaeon]
MPISCWLIAARSVKEQHDIAFNGHITPHDVVHFLRHPITAFKLIRFAMRVEAMFGLP